MRERERVRERVRERERERERYRGREREKEKCTRKRGLRVERPKIPAPTRIFVCIHIVT